MENSATETASREAGHETSDANVKIVWYAGLGLVVTTVVLMLIVIGMFHRFQVEHDAADQVDASQHVIPTIATSLPAFPGPRLQVAPEDDLAKLRAEDQRQLTQYGWIDKKAGVIRLPMDRAIDLIVQRGLPYRGEPGTPQPSRTVLDMQQARPNDWATQKQQAEQPIK